MVSVHISLICIGLGRYKSLEERGICAWIVAGIIRCRVVRVKKAAASHKRTFMEPNKQEGKIVVYRAYFMKLLATPKPLRDQLIIELPTFMAFRTGEICTAKADDVDFQRGDMQVLDSKKSRIFTVPLDLTVAEHLDQFIGECDVHDWLFYPMQKAGAKSIRPYLSKQMIDYVWRKWCGEAGIPYMPPRMGRAYFAVNWHIVEGKSLSGLMAVLRHDSLVSTEAYLSKIVSYEDVKSEFYRGKKRFSTMQCGRSDLCPLASDGCHCRMFSPIVKVERHG